jgi:WD40 repeat protein
MPTTRREAGILLLVEMAVAKPTAAPVDNTQTQEQLAAQFQHELRLRAQPCGYACLHSQGEGAVFFGQDPEALVELMLDLFVRRPIAPVEDRAIRLRLVAHYGFFRLVVDEHGQRTGIHGFEHGTLFPLARYAETWRLLVSEALFDGLRDLLEARQIEVRSLDFDEPLPGLGALGKITRWHKLIPPLPHDDSSHRLPLAYRQRREELREEVQQIPVFGDLYPPIPMSENFINLSVRAHADWTDRVGTAAWRRAEPEEHDRLFGPERDPLFGRERELRSGRIDLTADELFATFNKGCILGLPGAGKTTILRHFAWQTLEADPEALILFLNCREFRPHSFEGEGTAGKGLWKVLARAFLYHFQEVADLDSDQREAIAATARALQTAWENGRALILIDALDESPTEDIKEKVIQVARRLFAAVRQPLRDEAPVSNRFFLSARTIEWKRIDALEEPVFGVRDLTQDQMRLLAGRFFGYDSPTYRSFDEQIWQEPVVQKMGGTPLTALLLLFYFHIMGRFDVRYATYDLLLKFVLLEVWEKIKSKEFGQQYVRLVDFFEKVKQRDFLDHEPGIARQIQTLAILCYDCLFNTETGESLRDIPEQEVVSCFRTFLGSDAGGKLSEPEADREARAWFDAFLKEHLLIRTGFESFRFVHTTMMEFLAAGYLLAQKPGSRAFADVFHQVARQSRAGSLETLPLACGESCPTGYRLLQQLKARWAAPNADLLLPFRCLAEVETAEREQLHGLVSRQTLARARAEIQKGEPAKNWVYERLRRLVLDHDAERLRQARDDFSGQIPLCQTTFPQGFLNGWQEGGSDVVAARVLLLQSLLHPERFTELTSGTGPSGSSPRVTEVDLLMRDRPGDPQDKHFGYYRKLLGPTLQGFFGSPNFRHSGTVKALAFSVDGQLVVSASADCTLKLWDVASGRELRSFAGHADAVGACALSADGARLVSGSRDETLKLWDVASGLELRSFAGHENSVNACALSANGARLVSGSKDCTLKLWDVASGCEMRSFAGHTAPVWACALSADGARLVSGSADCTLKLWDVASGRELRSFAGHASAVWACALSADGARLVSGSSDRTLKLWDVASGRELRSFAGHADAVYACALSADGARLVSGSADCTLQLWDVASGRELRSFAGHADAVWACALSAHGARLVSGSTDRTLKLWDVASGREVRSFAGHTAPVWACALSADGARLVSGSADCTLKLWDLASGREVRSFARHADAVWACALSAHGARLVSGSADCTLKLWDLASGWELRSFAGHAGAVEACALSADGARLVSGSTDRTLKLWDLASGQEVRSFAGHADVVYACALSADGARLVSGSLDGTLKLWDVASGRELRSFAGHAGSVYACALSADGAWLVSGSRDQTLKLWDVASGRELASLKLPWIVRGIAPSPTQRGRFFTANLNGTVTIFDFKEFA